MNENPGSEIKNDKQTPSTESDALTNNLAAQEQQAGTVVHPSTDTTNLNEEVSAVNGIIKSAGADYNTQDTSLKKHIAQNIFLRISLLIYLINIIGLIVSLAVPIVFVVEIALFFSTYGGIVAALTLGLGLMKIASERHETGVHGINLLSIIGIMMILASVLVMYITPFPVLLLVPGLLLLIYGMRRPQSSINPKSNVMRIIASIAALIGGGTLGLVVSTVIYFFIWSRWCDLTSSKCM